MNTLDWVPLDDFSAGIELGVDRPPEALEQGEHIKVWCNGHTSRAIRWDGRVWLIGALDDIREPPSATDLSGDSIDTLFGRAAEKLMKGGEISPLKLTRHGESVFYVEVKPRPAKVTETQSSPASSEP